MRFLCKVRHICQLPVDPHCQAGIPHSRIRERHRFLCQVSCLEIYQEVVTDLLCPRRTRLALREDLRQGVHVELLTEETVTSGARTLYCTCPAQPRALLMWSLSECARMQAARVAKQCKRIGRMLSGVMPARGTDLEEQRTHARHSAGSHAAAGAGALW